MEAKTQRKPNLTSYAWFAAFLLFTIHLTACQGTAGRALTAVTLEGTSLSSPTWTETATATATTTPLPPTPTASRTPTQTPTPTPAPLLPLQAEVKGMWGYGQLLPLTCEARSAADWARNFGITIHELEFFARLPKSKNPEDGFVGSPKGSWGQVPPDSYGVHAKPVADVLRSYGAKAAPVRRMPFASLRAELAAGRPVMVWVTGHVAPGKGQPYWINGQMVTVAPFEHTVIITGYDEKTVTVLDGKTVYKRPIDTFLQSWAPLENMAIVWQPEKEKPAWGTNQKGFLYR